MGEPDREYQGQEADNYARIIIDNELIPEAARYADTELLKLLKMVRIEERNFESVEVEGKDIEGVTIFVSREVCRYENILKAIIVRRAIGIIYSFRVSSISG